MYYENFFKERKRKKEEEEKQRRLAEERRRQEEDRRRQEEERKRLEEERKRKEAEERRRQQKLQIARRFDSDIKQILLAYGKVKMKYGIFSTPKVEGPSISSSGVYWSLRCKGYNGVEITLNFRENAYGEPEPAHFTISGIYGGRSEAGLTTQELLDALADSEPQEYTPPPSYSDYSSCVCNMGIC